MANSLRSPVRRHPAPGPWAHAPLARLLARTVSPANEPVTEILLGPDDARSVHVAGDTSFTVLEGSVLVTCEGDREDHVVGAGQAFRPERHGHHVIAAFVQSRVRVGAAR